MSQLDWLMVVFWVGGTSLFGAYFVRFVETTRDYLVAGRRLNWWQVAFSQAADAVDATDFIGAAGQSYRVGAANLAFLWHGLGFGFLIMSRWIVPLLYRSGVYTNAEYLELRFNWSMRAFSALLQILYRLVALALVVYSIAVLFQTILNVDLWRAVWVAMILTMLYVFLGGQRGVAMAAIPQVALMVVTSAILFGYAWVEMGGWAGLADISSSDEGRLLQLAGHVEPGVPGGIYVWGLILTLVTYPITSQTVAQRLVSARSEADARRACIANLPLWWLLTGMSCALGFAALVLLPDVTHVQADQIFPVFMLRYLPSGLLGATVAAVMLASMSTGAGIGTAIAGLFTIDLYGRFVRPGSSDRHYLLVSRTVAILVIFAGTLLAMWVPRFGGMIPFYVALTGTFFLPLTVPYIGGALHKKASQWSGMAATGSGALVGLVCFLFSDQLPVFLGHPQWRPFWSLGIAWFTFFLWSGAENLIRGPIPDSETASILNVRDLGAPGTPESVRERMQRLRLRPDQTTDSSWTLNLGTPRGTRWYAHPTTLEIACLVFLVGTIVWWW